MIYWIVVLGGGAVAVSGYLLMFPFYGTDIAGMQTGPDRPRRRRRCCSSPPCWPHLYRHDRHGRRLRGDGHGTVDVNWAKQHHSLWLEEEKAKGNVSAPPPGRCSGGVAAARESTRRGIR